MSTPPTPATTVSVELRDRELHPRHGVHAPRPSAPERRAGSIRRTSTIDSIRPGDVLGDVVQIGRARDLRTARDGATTVLGEAYLRTRLDFNDRYRLTEIESKPVRVELGELIGASVSTGFRAAMAERVPGERDRATLLHLLLDDLPGAALVSGYAIGHAGRSQQRQRVRTGPMLQFEGLCAGFQGGGTIMREMEAGRHPPVVTGPLASSLTAIDPDAWHELREMGAHDMRRWRCVDVVPGGRADDPVEVEAYFRDSHVAPDGAETVIHEYTLVVHIDPVEECILSSGAAAHSLPWVECIEAVGSGDRLAGLALEGLRSRVREEFVGVTTCTHLNDTMRSIEDVRAMLPLLRHQDR